MSLSSIRFSFWICLLLPVYGVVPSFLTPVNYSTEPPVYSSPSRTWIWTSDFIAKGPDPINTDTESSIYIPPSTAEDEDSNGVNCYYYRKEDCDKAKGNSTELNHSNFPECRMQQRRCQRLCEAQAMIEDDNSTILVSAICGDKNSVAISSGTCETSKMVGENNVFVCVCEGHLCNKEARYIYQPPTTSTDRERNLQSGWVGLNLVAIFVPASIVVLMILVLIITVCFYKMSKAPLFPRRMGYKDGMAESTSSSHHSDSESYCLNEIAISPQTEKLDIDIGSLVPLARGRFGVISLLPGQIDGMQCILKLMTAENKLSWEQEKTILTQPGMTHENIIRYVGHVCKDSQYAIILQYHRNGSLFSYLKGHTVSWAELLKISHGMLKGLAHLHEPLKISTNQYKCPIAHRDIKSENIILDHDLTAKITDFNLAKMHASSILPSNDVNVQVGTARYMSPELLSCFIGTTRDSMLTSDIYAMSYVMWEVLNRCECYSPASAEYEMPLEDLVGRDPSISSMKEVVVDEKKRPRFRVLPLNEYREDVEELISMIEGCWEEEWNNRYSAANVESKLYTLMQQHGQTSRTFVREVARPNIMHSSTEDSSIDSPLITRNPAVVNSTSNCYRSVSNRDKNSNFSKPVQGSKELVTTNHVYFV